MTNIDTWIDHFVARNASDLYITVGAKPLMRTAAGLVHVDDTVVSQEISEASVRHILSDAIYDEFSSTLEYNTAINWKGVARLRINLFRQQQNTGMVLRRIHTQIPDFNALGLPPIYGNLVMEKRGLILIVGPTGAGKSSSLASMLEYRNQHGSGHIVTIEDPVEFMFQHKNCIITQRDIGIDTYSFGIGLKNTLRQAPDVVVIGEIRDREAMEHAITFAETGHLCLATLHANNANQAIERILNFFPEERHKQILLNLSLNLRAILSQRLMTNMAGSRTLATEIMLNQGLIKQLIHDGQVKEIKACIEKAGEQGMQTFDQHLTQLCEAGIISEEIAMIEADSPSNVRLALKQKEMAIRHNTPMNFAENTKQF